MSDCGGRHGGTGLSSRKMLPVHTHAHTYLCTHTNLKSSVDMGKAQHYET